MSTNVCGKCQAQFLPKLMGVTVVETAGNPPRAFRMWRADVQAFPICHAELVTDFSHEPTMENYESGFDAVLAEVPPERKRIMYSPEYLTQKVMHETKLVRSYANRRVPTNS